MSPRTAMTSNTIWKRSLITLLCSCCLGSTAAYAEETPDTDGCQSSKGGAVTVTVRTIQASGAVDTSERSDAAPAVTLEQNLADLEPKLAQLPYRSFKLVAAKEQKLELKRKELLTLPNGQSVAVRPMFSEHRRVGLWLNWLDSDGSEILNTRVHFDTEDSIVTGTDASQNEGLILAIRAVPTTHAVGN